jgi:hypothetical protein
VCSAAYLRSQDSLRALDADSSDRDMRLKVIETRISIFGWHLSRSGGTKPPSDFRGQSLSWVGGETGEHIAYEPPSHHFMFFLGGDTLIVFFAALPIAARLVLWIVLARALCFLYMIIVDLIIGPPQFVLISNRDDNFQSLNLTSSRRLRIPHSSSCDPAEATNRQGRRNVLSIFLKEHVMSLLLVTVDRFLVDGMFQARDSRNVPNATLPEGSPWG